MAQLDQIGQTYSIHKGGDGTFFELHCNFEIVKTAKSRATLNKLIDKKLKAALGDSEIKN